MLELLFPVAAAVVAPSPWPWSWSSVMPLNYGNNASGWDDPAELARKARYKMLFTDGGVNHGYDPTKDWRWHEEAQMSEQIKRYSVAAPGVPAFLYRPGVNIPRSFMSSKIENDTDKIGWWSKSAITGRPTPLILNLSVAAAADYWHDVYLGSGAWDDPHAAGVFIDGGNPGCAVNNFTTLADRQALFNDTVSAWHRAAATLNGHGKRLIITMRDHFANTTLPAGSLDDHTKTTCPYPEDLIFDGMAGTDWVAHREFHPDEVPPPSSRSPDACATTILDWAYEARAATASLWCTYDIKCIPSQHPVTASQLDDNCTVFTSSLAMFLLGAEASSYFGASGGYSDWPVAQWPWWPAYDRSLGPPKHRLKRSAGTARFTRGFAHADVFFDCDTGQAGINWH